MSITTIQPSMIDPIYENTWVPASFMTTRVTNGALFESAEATGNDINTDYYLFDSATEEGVQFLWPIPDEWNNGTINAKIVWGTNATGTGGVTWGIAGQARTDDEAIDNAFPASTDIDDTRIAAGDWHVSPVATGITISGTPVVGDLILFEITRVVGDTNDTLAYDAQLFGVWIQWYNDSPVTTSWS